MRELARSTRSTGLNYGKIASPVSYFASNRRTVERWFDVTLPVWELEQRQVAIRLTTSPAQAD
jgi:hypothetical protein